MSIAAKTNRLVQLRLYFKTEIHCDFVLSKYCALHEYRAAKEDKLNHKQRCKATGSRLRALAVDAGGRSFAAPESWTNIRDRCNIC
jgi:hypothetical protein